MEGMLASFIRFLEEKRLVKFDIDGDSDECFENRLKLQKYVYFARRFGLKLPYRHSMYLYGPYSRTLVTDCYKIARDRSLYDSAAPDLPSEFDHGSFLRSVKNDPKWLEIATTLIEQSSAIGKRDKLVENVERTKNGVKRRYIESVLGDLDRHDLIKVRR